MRVLQLIDSLRPGGAEKMAVNIANALLPHVEKSHLCCTRKEGLLKNEIKEKVGYLFLNKKSSLDPKAILKLKKYIQDNKIDLVHAHSTSYFLACLLKLSGSKFKLIWHDHYGESENLKAREFKVLRIFSQYFTGIVSVNTTLKEWAEKNLKCNRIIEIRNFIAQPDSSAKAKIRLKGAKEDFKIICVANLRPQKDHFNLLRAFEKLNPTLDISLHLIGEDPGNNYSASVLDAIKNNPMKNKIFYYGTQPEIISLLKQADLGVLPSRSEGLPLALLEYGMAGLSVISTRVGKCPEVIGSAGIIINPKAPEELKNALIYYLENSDRGRKDAAAFHSKIAQEFHQEIVVKKIFNFYCSSYQ